MMGGISSSRTRAAIPFKDVFQHHATPSQIDTMRGRILTLADQCINRHGVDTNFPNINDVAESLSDESRYKFNSVLYCQTFAPAKKRTIADELAWKWSETTGKFIGCPFWSLDAKDLFDRELTKSTTTLQDAWTLAYHLASNARSHNQQITHEHVFPKRRFCEILFSMRTPVALNELRGLFSHLAVGCVVLESEHPSNHLANRDNPWRRYEGITLVENLGWPEEHKRLIEQAGLQVVLS
jgi:hypothetical protein